MVDVLALKSRKENNMKEVRRLLFALVSVVMLTLSLTVTPVKAEPSGCPAWRESCLQASYDYQDACLASGGSGVYCSQQQVWFNDTCRYGLAEAGCYVIQ